MSSSKQVLRQEASGKSWKEQFVDVKQASTSSSVGSAVSKSWSYIVIPEFATVEERQALLDSALDIQSEEKNGGSSGIHSTIVQTPGMICSRYSVKASLNEQANMTSDILYGRLIDFLEGTKADENDEITDVTEKIFGRTSNLHEMTTNWYDEPDKEGNPCPEPKVNIYNEGGAFYQHGDGMHMTLLVVLEDQFEGGGTAFYEKEVVEPACIEKPPAGTAMLWSSDLLHMALPVTKGMRSVFVGSFDLVHSLDGS